MEPIAYNGDGSFQDRIWKATNELISAESSLNMPPEELPNLSDDDIFLSDRDRWANHAMKHIHNAIKILNNLER
jgi:hypothetical protein